MLLRNPFTSDSRVEKEAALLASRGMRVAVIAGWQAGLPTHESRRGFDVVRTSRRVLTRPILKPPRPRVQPDAAGLHTRPRLAKPLRHIVKEWIKDTPLVFGPASYLLRLAGNTMQRVRVYREVVRRAPKTIHCHDLNTLPAGALLALRTRSRLVYDAHELWAERLTTLRGWRRRWDNVSSTFLERHLIKRAATVITVSDGVARELVDRYGIEYPVILHNVPTRTLVPVGSLRERADVRGPIWLYLGGVTIGRGIEEAIDALALLPEVSLVLMGPANAEVLRSLERKVETLELRSRFRHLPPVPPAEIVSWAAQADVGLINTHPLCLNNVLSLPNKLFEYAFAGIPVVASDLPQIREWVTRFKLGVVVDPAQPSQIANGVCDVLDGRVPFMSPDEHQRFTAQFSWESEGEKLAAVYGLDNLSEPVHARANAAPPSP